MAQLMPLPLTASCFSKIQIGFTFLVPADPGSPGKRAVKRVCVCVCSSLLLYGMTARSQRIGHGKSEKGQGGIWLWKVALVYHRYLDLYVLHFLIRVCICLSVA